MGKTIQEILAECTGEPTQTKTASAGKQSTSTEIDEVLKNLGLDGAETVKTASDQTKTSNGGNMSLKDIYENFMDQESGETAPATTAAEGSTKTAAEGEDAEAHDFGSLVGHYFNVMAEPFFSKVAEHMPLDGVGGESALGKTMGSVGDPHLPVNHDTSSEKPIPATTANKGSYDGVLKGSMIKAILKRKMSSEAGDVGGFHG